MEKRRLKKQVKVNKDIEKKPQVTSRYWLWLSLIVVLAMTYFSYQPAMKAKFTNWDDDKYVTDNPVIKDVSGTNLNKLLTGNFEGNYHPLTMLSFAWNYSQSKLDPEVYHRTNVFLHLLNTLLVFWFILLLLSDVRLATIASALFGIHTLHVESVAWISERKDVLYAFFFLLSLIAYIHYIKKESWWFYMLSLILFALSLFSKGMAVSLALSLFLIDFYFERSPKNRKAILDKIPFLLLALVFGYIAIRAQNIQSFALANEASFPFMQRILFAGYGFFNYLGKLVYPYHLAMFYPYPIKPGETLPLLYVVFLLLSLGIAAFILYTLKFSKKYFFGFAFFVINILLVLQLVSVGKALMADRYTYVSSIGIFFLAASAFQAVKPSFRKYVMGLIVVYSVVLVFLTRDRCKVWHDSLTLWNDQVLKYPGHVDAYKNRGLVKGPEGDYQGAIADFTKAIELDPTMASAYTDRGMAKQLMKDTLGALSDYSTAISINPQLVLAYSNRANLHMAMNNFQYALDDLNLALTITPGDATMYYERGRAHMHFTDMQPALDDFSKAIALKPEFALAYSNRGLIKMNLKEHGGAMTDFNLAIQRNPRLAIAYYNRGVLKYNSNDLAGACTDFKSAQDYGYPDASGLIKQICK